jgi:hypothetical protein
MATTQNESFVVQFKVTCSTPIPRITLIYILQKYLSQKDNIITRATTTSSSFKLDEYDILINLKFISYANFERCSNSYVSASHILKLIPSICCSDNIGHLYNIPNMSDDTDPDTDPDTDDITEYNSFVVYSDIYNKLYQYSSVSL